MFFGKQFFHAGSLMGTVIPAPSASCGHGASAMKRLRPMIMRRIRERENQYPIPAMVPVAVDVLKAREDLIDGVSSLMKEFPVLACTFCPEVYIGAPGHLIRTCSGFRHQARNRVHGWTAGVLNNVLVPVKAFHPESFCQDAIQDCQRFDFARVPAVVELCLHAGAPPDHGVGRRDRPHIVDVRSIAQETVRAWETVRSGVKRLLLPYHCMVCEHCSEVHVVPSGHNAHLRRGFGNESSHGSHFWRNALLDDIVPPRLVWRRRPQDPPVLEDGGRDFYGHAPAVIELCSQAGADIPKEYFCVMKLNGLSPQGWCIRDD